MTVDEMVAQALTYIYEDRLEPADAAEKAFVADDREAVRSLAVIGLRSLVGGALADDRRRGADMRSEGETTSGALRSGRFQHRTRPSEGAAYFWLSKHYSTSDGRSLPILEHSLADDVPFNLENARGKRAGWQAREELWVKLQEVAADHPRARLVGDLPKKVLVELEAAAAVALRGGVVA